MRCIINHAKAKRFPCNAISACANVARFEFGTLDSIRVLLTSKGKNMKKNPTFLSVLHFALLAIASASSAFAGVDPCRAIALNAAENVYNNDPMKTSITTVKKSVEYDVSVGKGNQEDGEHTYQVLFSNGCGPQSPKPSVKDISCPQCN